MTGNVIIIANNEIRKSKIPLKTIDRPSMVECLYSRAMMLSIFSGVYTTSSKKYHSLM
jgi:hypothetical protein